MIDSSFMNKHFLEKEYNFDEGSKQPFISLIESMHNVREKNFVYMILCFQLLYYIYYGLIFQLVKFY